MSTAPINRPVIDAQPDPDGLLITSTVDGFGTEFVVSDERLSALGFIRKSAVDEAATELLAREPEMRAIRPVAVEFTAASKAVLEEWHNTVHPGVFRTCTEQPCRPLIKSMETY